MRKENWEKFNALTFRKKLEYIWEYYHWHFIVTVLVLIVAVSWISGIVRNREPLLELEMINCYLASPEGEVLQPFIEQEGLEYFDGAGVINKQIQVSSEDESQNYAGYQLLACVMAAGEGDLFFWDDREPLTPLKNGALVDLREILTEEELEKYRDILIYCPDTETGEMYPCGLYLEENPWIRENQFYVNCAVGVSVCSDDPVLAGDFLRYLLNS